MKKLIKVFTVVALVLALSVPVFAGFSGRCGVQRRAVINCYSMIWDADGNLVERDTFEANIDQLIKDGYLLKENKDNYLDMYDYCAENANGQACPVYRGGGCCGRNNPAL